MGGTGLAIIEKAGIEPLTALRCECDGLEDARFQPFAKRLLSDIVMITLIAAPAGCDERGETAEFVRQKEARFKKFLVLPNGSPPHDTIQRAASIIEQTQQDRPGRGKGGSHRKRLFYRPRFVLIGKSS